MTVPYILGLDIGMASVGWCCLGETRIINWGVRAFDKAETAKEGESLNLIRRTARLMRRRLFRRAWRLKKLARLLKQEGVITDTKLFSPAQPSPQTLWQLRVAGLDRILNAEEWARVLYHICKHRGFHWISRAEAMQAEGDAKSEGGKVKQGLASTRKLMLEKNYRTIAEMVLHEFPKAQRNKHGEYDKALSRELLANELAVLFVKQRALGNPHAHSRLETALLGQGDQKSGLLWQQKPAMAGADLLAMLGRCTLEKTAYRAPKASFTAERHVWVTRLNNLRIVVQGHARPLTESERQVCLLLPYQQAGDLTYKQVRKALVDASLLTQDSFQFYGMQYPIASHENAGKAKDPETATLVKLPAWHTLRKTLTGSVKLDDAWKKLSCDALMGQPELMDQIAWVLSVYKADDEVAAELSKLQLPHATECIEVLLNVRFDKFHALSLKALRAIVPHMEQGLRYDEACAAAGYDHSQLHKVGAGQHQYLPPFYQGRDSAGRMKFVEDLDIPRNPVVLRALNQARKVVNAIIRLYGSPLAVHIEMARDLSRPFDERNDIKKDQEEYRARNERDRAQFAQTFGRMPNGAEFEKYRLYREQMGQCAYSQKPLAPNGNVAEIFQPGVTEIDHVLPYSRSFDDSKNNKVLVLTKENRDKGNRTPYEYLGGAENSERWQRFVAFVQSNKSYRLAKRIRLLRKDFAGKESEGFRDRNLSDTRYICRFFKNYVEQYLKLAQGSPYHRCVVVSGQLTNFLRARWGLIKVRSESDRHHALDAAVVAACSHSMVQRLSNYARTRELRHVKTGFADPDTGEIVNADMHRQLEAHFPEPWPHFRHELEARLKLDQPDLLRQELLRLGNYSEDDLNAVKPLFVSRAPQRRNSGAAHKDTIYGQTKLQKRTSTVTQKVPLSSLSLKDLDDLADPERNAKLYAAIRARLEAHGGKGDKAFPVSNPLYKPDKEGKPTGPIVRSVTKVIDKLSGISVRGGIAKNDTMLRVDVFSKAGKFHLVPVYVHHRVKGLPNRAIVAYKFEDEWTLIDDSYIWCFSLYPNDLVCVELKGEKYFGYYAGADRATGAIGIWAHDRNKTQGKAGLYRVGVKTAVALSKFFVDPLGKVYPAPPEPRRGLA